MKPAIPRQPKGAFPTVPADDPLEAELAKVEWEWEVARLFPPKGEWTEADYFSLSTNRLVELSDGCLEWLPRPTEDHQRVLLFLYQALHRFVSDRNLGEVLIAALPVRLWEGKIREPDLLFMRSENASRCRGQHGDGADWVAEIVHESRRDRDRDLVIKRGEYAQAAIPEYWIVDPFEERVTVLTLSGKVYQVYAEFGRGGEASSVLFPGFAVSVRALLNAP